MPGWFHRDSTMPEDWQATVARRVVHWASFDEDQRGRLGELIEHLFVRNRWEAARGFELTDEMRLVIAAQASRLLLGLDISWYSHVGSIIVHPTTMVRHGVRPGPAEGVFSDDPIELLGEAELFGPVVLAWDTVRRDAAHPERGHDVVFHEFAHKLDMLDNSIDGMPPLPTDEARQRWITVCTAEYDQLRSGPGDGLLDSYGATNVGEFFAVATESFFTRPAELREAKPDLYEVLRDFYLQDPAGRCAR